MNDARKRRLVAALKGKAIEVDHFAELRGPDNPEEAKLWLQTRDDLLELVHAYDNPRPRTAAEALEQAFCRTAPVAIKPLPRITPEDVARWQEEFELFAEVERRIQAATDAAATAVRRSEVTAEDWRILSELAEVVYSWDEYSLRTDDYDTLLDVLANADTSTQTANDLLALNDLQYRLQRARDAAYSRGAAAKTEDDLTQP